MDISRKNYESFFIDYLDGGLSPEQVVELMTFLEENPDLKEELNEFEKIKIEPGKVSFSSKTSLKKGFVVSDSNFNDLCIASLEGDLTKEEATVFQNWLQQNPLKTREFELYKKACLIPEKIIFDYKSTLKKSPVGRIFTPKVWGYFSAAASIIILITLYLFISRPDNENTIISEIITDTTNIKPKSQTGPEHQTKTDIEKEIIPYDKPGDLTKLQESKPQNIKVIEKPVYKRQITNIVAELNHLALFNTNETPLHKIHRKENLSLPQNPVLLSLADSRQFDVTEVSGNNLTLSQMIIKTFKIRVLEENEDAVDFDNLSLWDIADAGIRGVNKIVGWEMELDKEYSEEGDLIALAFDSNTVSFSRSLK